MTIGIGPSGALLHTIRIGIGICLGIGIGQWKHTIRLGKNSIDIASCVVGSYSKVPTRTRKPGKMGRHFSSEGKVREKSHKNTGKLEKFVICQ